MADQLLSWPFLLAVFVLYILQIRLLNAEGNSTKIDECKVVGDLSLDGLGTTDKGVVFVCFNNGGTLEWGVICTSNWDDVDAKVVCSQLGYGGSSKAVKNAQHEFLSVSALFKDVTMDNVKCIGNETRLIDCKHGSICSNSFMRNLAGVQCNDKGNDGGGGFSNDFDDDQYDNTWDSGGDGSSSRPRDTPTIVVVGVICVIVIVISGIIRCMKRNQRQARQQNHIQNTTLENFQMVPPNHPSNYQVGQHPPPGSAVPNAQHMYPTKSQAGQMMPQSYPSPYPTGADQHPPPGGMIPPSQPNPYPTGGPAQYPPPAGMMPPSQPNPYPTTGGPAQYPPPAGMMPPSTPFIPSNVGTDFPNCPPPSYDDTFKSEKQ